MGFKKVNLLSFVLFFAFGVIFATNVSATETWVKVCSITKGSTENCTNEGSGKDRLAYFKNKLVDRVKATSSYNLYFSYSTNYPSVTRGAPVYGKFYVNDNKNKKFYSFSNFEGKYLTDYSSLQVSTNKNTGYYPGSGQRPTTNMYIKNGDPFECGGKPGFCNTYINASQFDID